MPTPAALDRSAAAAYLGVRPSTLERWERESRGPRSLKLSPTRQGRRLYLVAELDAWLAAGAPRDQRGDRLGDQPTGRFSPPSGQAGRDQRGRFANVRRDA